MSKSFVNKLNTKANGSTVYHLPYKQNSLAHSVLINELSVVGLSTYNSY
jgi:hypothetical protein